VNHRQVWVKKRNIEHFSKLKIKQKIYFYNIFL
jgi:hypothetical protein